MTRARIVGTGQYLPEKILTNKDLEQRCDTTDEWIRKRTGIEQRHVAADDQGTSDLAIPACEMALEDAGVSADEIELLICCTLSPDHFIPSTGSLIQGRLGANNAGAFDLNAACSGFMYGLTTAKSFIESGMYNTIVVVGAEIQTNRITWKNRDTSVLFADGAGAVVLRAEEGDHGVLATHLGSDGANFETLHTLKGGSKTPVTPENVNDDPYTIYMKGPELFKRAVIEFGLASNRVLDEAGIAMEDLSLFVGHQANARILEAAAQRMGLPSEKLFININKVGNTTAASIPIAIHQARAAGRINEGDYILLASFGAGLTWGSAVVRW